LQISAFTPVSFHHLHTSLAIFHPAHVKQLGFTLASTDLIQAHLFLVQITATHHFVSTVARIVIAEGRQAPTNEPFKPMSGSMIQLQG
jgi:hypothetical protein